MTSSGLLKLIIAFLLIISFSGALKASTEEDSIQVGSLPPLCESMGIYNSAKCKNQPKISRFRCDDIGPPPAYWGGLDPYKPMAVCRKYKKNATGPAVRMTGCKTSVREQYVVLMSDSRKGDIILIEDKNQFRKFFAPIKNGNEAVSYISALTGSYPITKFPDKYFIRNIDEGGKYTTSNLKPTNFKEKKDGFTVNLFSHETCGCHTPELYEINYFVSRNGNIKELKKRTIWKADRLYRICID